MELSPAFSNIFWIERHVLSLTAQIIWFLIIRSRIKLPMSLQLRMGNRLPEQSPQASKGNLVRLWRDVYGYFQRIAWAVVTNDETGHGMSFHPLKTS